MATHTLALSVMGQRGERASIGDLTAGAIAWSAGWLRLSWRRPMTSSRTPMLLRLVEKVAEAVAEGLAEREAEEAEEAEAEAEVEAEAEAPGLVTRSRMSGGAVTRRRGAIECGKTAFDSARANCEPSMATHRREVMSGMAAHMEGGH